MKYPPNIYFVTVRNVLEEYRRTAIEARWLGAIQDCEKALTALDAIEVAALSVEKA